ncbi:MAG TPA: SDR family oxidoreductase [Tepidisphaeraceae bacterium]|nr:SDR family oxidoreductase [Tepidisphaeraceae bacterium]
MRLKEKVIIVTGSTTGIGEAVARRCVAEGARVLVHGLERDLGEAVARELGDAARLHLNDLSEADAATDLIRAALAAFGGRIDGLVNNAAWIPRANLDKTDATLFDRTMAINVRAPLLLIKAALPALAAARGSVVNIGSINAYCGEPNLLPYSLSKGALMTLTRNLGDALHRDHGVRVNQINPGWIGSANEHRVQTAMGKPADWVQRLPKEFAPSGDIIPPEVIAAAVAYWLSDESRPISGTVMEMEQYPVIGRNPPKEP